MTIEPTTESFEAEEVAAVFLWLIAQSILDDTHWKAFGYKGQPKRGRIWNRFLSKDRLARETFLLREFSVISLAHVIRAVHAAKLGELELTLLSRVFEKLVMGAEGGIPFWEVFSFASPGQYSLYLSAGVKAYLVAEHSGSTSCLLSRINDAFPSPPNAQWIVGSAAIFSLSACSIPWITTRVRDAFVGRIITGTVQLKEPAFFDFFQLIWKGVYASDGSVVK